MAGSSSEEWRRRRHADMPTEEPEEGEFVPGYHSDDDTEDYYNRHSPLSGSDETISACSVVPAAMCGGSGTPSSSSVVAGYGGGASASSPAAANNVSNGNGSTNDASSASAVVVAAPAAHACPICGKEFRSTKAVCGHMKVHQLGIGLHQEQRKIKGKGTKRERDVAAVAAGWGGAGKRGCTGTGTGSRASSSTAEPEHQPMDMDIVVAQPEVVMQAMPLAFAPPNPSSLPMASAIAATNPATAIAATNLTTAAMPSSTTTTVSGESSSAKQTQNDAMETAVAGAASPSAEAATHPHAADAAPAPPQPPPAGVQDPSAHKQPTEHPPPSPAPPAAAAERAPAVHQQPVAPRRVAKAAGRQNPNGYRCSQCNMWFELHQGLGGHMAGHKNRELAAGMLRDGGAGPSCRNDDEPPKEYKCKVCGKVYDSGVKLGGHMRKHYTGPPIVPKRKPRLAVNHQPLPLLPPAEPVAAPAPAMADNAHEVPRGPAVEAAAQPAAPTPTPVQTNPAPAMAGNAHEAPRGPAVEAAAQPAAPTPTPVQTNPEPSPRPAAVAGRVILFGVDIGAGKQTPSAQDGSSSSAQGSASAPGEQ